MTIANILSRLSSQLGGDPITIAQARDYLRANHPAWSVNGFKNLWEFRKAGVKWFVLPKRTALREKIDDNIYYLELDVGTLDIDKTDIFAEG